MYITKTRKLYNYGSCGHQARDPETIAEFDFISEALDHLLELKKSDKDHVYYMSTKPTKGWREKHNCL
jgi:hypothetical protein